VTLEAGTPIGKYVVKHKLAEGGMAELYLATATGPEGFEKEVVIKRVRSFLAGDEGFVKMFIAEAQLASRLNHANVVQIFDFARHEDSYYLAMEYVRGCSLWELRKRCREQGVVMPPLLVAHIGAQVAAGLHHAHRLKSPDGAPLGLVHRDVSPHNVLLSLDGAVKLTDFGIAKAGHTQSGMLKGKFAYMSPEQARGEEVDARTDVFALGIVLWEMLTGGRLFDGDSDVAVLRAVRESVIAPPARLNPDVPKALDEVVSIALQRHPEARFQSAGEMERALAQCVLSHARSVDDTDVGAFVRRLLDAPPSPFIQTPAALMDRTQRSGEPTAVLPGTGPSSGRGRLVRTAPPEESLVFASTLVLPRDMKADEEAPGSEGQGSSSMPAATSRRESAGAKRGGKGLWVGGGVVALVFIGGATALVLPVKEPAPTASSPAPTAMAPAVPNPVFVPTTGETPAATPTETATAPEVEADAPTTAAPDSSRTQLAEADTIAEARGSLIVRAIPFATVIVSGQKPREVLGRSKYTLAPGKYTVTFQHPSGSETHDVTITPEGSVTRSFTARKK
jgi:eukaryotic-like serine/threonine-protein kinase